MSLRTFSRCCWGNCNGQVFFFAPSAILFVFFFFYNFFSFSFFFFFYSIAVSMDEKLYFVSKWQGGGNSSATPTGHRERWHRRLPPNAQHHHPLVPSIMPEMYALIVVGIGEMRMVMGLFFFFFLGPIRRAGKSTMLSTNFDSAQKPWQCDEEAIRLIKTPAYVTQ